MLVDRDDFVLEDVDAFFDFRTIVDERSLADLCPGGDFDVSTDPGRLLDVNDVTDCDEATDDDVLVDSAAFANDAVMPDDGALLDEGVATDVGLIADDDVVHDDSLVAQDAAITDLDSDSDVDVIANHDILTDLRFARDWVIWDDATVESRTLPVELVGVIALLLLFRACHDGSP